MKVGFFQPTMIKYRMTEMSQRKVYSFLKQFRGNIFCPGLARSENSYPLHVSKDSQSKKWSHGKDHIQDAYTKTGTRVKIKSRLYDLDLWLCNPLLRPQKDVKISGALLHSILQSKGKKCQS